jgi:hypothetical protein
MFSSRVFSRAALAGILVFGMSLAQAAARVAPKFFDDDPLWREPDSQDASKVAPWTIDLAVDLLFNLFGKLGDQTPDVRARNVNTVDEVPDSSWFTNRAGRRPLTAADVAIGPDTDKGPVAGTWTITSAKSDGITPGFTIRDPAGTRWFLKFDPPGHRAMATGTEVAVTKLMWALGYFVPENHLARLRIEQLAIGDGARVTPPGESPRAMKLSDISALLKRADREPDGSYRVIASKAVSGRPLGGFRFHDTRPDDPNDVVPHEHRRELRGYGVFAAWINHVDAKAINSLDTLITGNGRSYVQHYLIDFGSTLGSAGVAPRDAWEGTEYMVQPKDIAKGLGTFGFFIAPWRTVDLYESAAAGAMPRDNTAFDPDRWRPRVPNQAFLRARADDKFWAATKLAAISDEMIRAAVDAGQFGDPAAAEFLTRALVDRRNAILKAYLPAINPIGVAAIGAEGTLTLSNAAVSAGVAAPPSAYRAVWSSFDNATGESRRIGETSSATTRVPPPDSLAAPAGGFMHVELTSTGGPQAWAVPVHAYFRRTIEGWTFVGFERMR